MELLPVQVTGVEFIHKHKHVLCNDPIGTGKTIQAIAAVKDCKTILVVCPNMVKYTWYEELKKMGEDPTTDKWHIINYEKLIPSTTYYKTVLSRLRPDAVIFDECHLLKNRKALRTKSAIALVKRTKPEYLIPMTATPIVKGVVDYWPTLHILDSKKYSSFWAFAKKHANARPGQFGWEWDAVATNPHILMDEIKPFHLCRERNLENLPPITHSYITLEPTPDQYKLMVNFAKDLLVEIGDENMVITSVLARFTRLRQIGISPRLIGAPDIGAKLPALLSISESTSEKIVVFSSFVEALKLASTYLSDAGVSSSLLVGEMTTAERDSAIRQFLWGQTQVLLASIDLASAGMNFQQASVVVFLDQSMSPAINEQALGRVFRQGQINPVSVYYLTIIDGMDERVLAILSNKQNAINGIAEALKQIREDDSW